MHGNPEYALLALLVGLSGTVPSRPAAAAESIVQPHRQDAVIEDAFIEDGANVVDSATRQRWRGWLTELNSRKPVQIRIITRRDPLPEDIDRFTQRTFDAWQQELDLKSQSVLVVLALAECRVQIRISDGLQPTLPEAWQAELKTEIATEYFRREEYARGLDELLIRMLNRIAEDAGIELEGLPARASREADDHRSVFPWWVLLLLAVLVILGVLQARRRRRQAYDTWADSEGFGAAFPTDGLEDAAGDEIQKGGERSSRGTGW
jgi:uncharacterized membrane protein YgcG